MNAPTANDWNKVSASIDGEECTWMVRGPITTGPDVVLLDRDDDLLAQSCFRASGFGTVKALDPDALLSLRRSVHSIVNALVQTIHPGLIIHDLGRYHECVPEDVHREMHRSTSGYHPVGLLGEALPSITTEVERHTSATLTTLSFDDIPASFGLRIVRPGSSDHNPPHRDAWIDRLRHSLSVYLPIAGSSPASSLPVVEGSHRWSEAATARTLVGAVTPERTFTVPACVPLSGVLSMTRPPVPAGSMLVFSPYLVHGGAANVGSDTRVSIELRFERRDRKHWTPGAPTASTPTGSRS